ncbi:MAG: hypothetical protein WA432_04370 [Candidatus Babeliaceae bacterium]
MNRKGRFKEDIGIGKRHVVYPSEEEKRQKKEKKHLERQRTKRKKALKDPHKRSHDGYLLIYKKKMTKHDNDIDQSYGLKHIKDDVD